MQLLDWHNGNLLCWNRNCSYMDNQIKLFVSGCFLKAEDYQPINRCYYTIWETNYLLINNLQ